MADPTRAEELIREVERDGAFSSELEAASGEAKRQVLDAHGFQDVGLEEMRAYVERLGGTLIAPDGGRELSEQELAAVAGGGLEDTPGAVFGITVGVGLAVGAAAAAA